MSTMQTCKKCSKVETLYREISGLTDLSPSTTVNRLFSELVSLAISDLERHKLAISKLNHLQQICSASEYELEKYWANRIVNSKNPKLELVKFPYFQNYLDLTKLEYFSIKGCTEHEVHHYLFVGGGPLPMTAIVLAKIYGVRVTIIDYDKQACKISEELISKLELGDLIYIVNQDGAVFNDYGKYDVVFVAALAGIDKNIKANILKQIKLTSRPDTHILARSSWGNRQLLYKSLGKEVYKMFTPVIEVHPQNHIVNSVIVMKT